MEQNGFSWELFLQMPIVGISRNIPGETLSRIIPLYQDAGLSTLEITMNTPNAEGLIAASREQAGAKLNIGAGTVCSMDDLRRSLAAGAQFIVTPVLDEEIVRHCAQRQIPVFPGAFTPSEIYRAWGWGAPIVKVFPSGTLGPGYIKDLKGPLPQIKLLPTGGVGLHNLKAFMDAGASGLGIGSELLDKSMIQAGNWDGLLAHFRLFVAGMQ